MFQKEGSSALGGKKDAAVRKSDRRKLRDRTRDALFGGGGGEEEDAGRAPPAARHARAARLVDDAVAGGEVAARRLTLAGGERATLYLRRPGGAAAAGAAAAPPGEDPRAGGPDAWPYREGTLPLLLEYEDAERRQRLVPLLPLLAALPPPPPEADATAPDDAADSDVQVHRIPNVLVHSEVSKYLCRGADLMRSGMRRLPPPWRLRRCEGLVTVAVAGNPQPMAVGRLDEGLLREHCRPRNGRGGGAADALVGPGTKGVGVRILTCYGDDLWKAGLPSRAAARGPRERAAATGGAVGNPWGGGWYDDGHFGNVGFVDGTRVLPIVDVSGDEGESHADESEGKSDEGGGQDDRETGDGVAAAAQSQAAPSEGSPGEGPPGEGPIGEGPSGSDAAEDVGPDHDAILAKAFYGSLLALLSSKAPLPMPVSTYYAKHLLAAVPAAGPRLEMKKTARKKIGPFLTAMAATGVVALGPSKDGKDRCAFLSSIVKDHPDLARFRREQREAAARDDGGAAPGVPAATPAATLAVVDLFVVPPHVAAGLRLDEDAVRARDAKADARKGTGFLTRAECRALLERYVEEEGLADPAARGRVRLDGPLCDALYRASKKDRRVPGTAAEYPTSVKRKDLIERWLDKMEPAHALVQMPGSQILNLSRGGPKLVEIEVEFRQGNRKKFLTRLRGVEEYGIEAAALSQDVARRFACAATVETTAPAGRPALKKDRAELVFQGHLAGELTALLTGDEKASSHGGAKGGVYRLPKRVIHVVVRKGVPARKKG